MRARATTAKLIDRTYNRRYVPTADLDEWEDRGWVRSGAVREGPFGTELHEITLEDIDG